MALTSQAYLDGSSVKQTKSLITELCRLFYNLGWVGGTGGSITAKVHDDSVPKSDQLIIMSPSATVPVAGKLYSSHPIDHLCQMGLIVTSKKSVLLHEACG
ncbi:bifunctional methylthioribulose-1-phosphate dehydratase/enolase-phosphatase E1 1 [Artemisia annua]|uniref:Bifunctional methylthioribulose-1-phosphate dehydratase/enolase-phosphatase E1 1 n=1 Tax=Artemisia annua TaxID=35608 RepID=A0A2U1M233_ARTAN|nr:bifunctional methylthioribulose-1-phosphate dehydratase/enolase-phosphatase E1 1 [Artemisia annua]